MKGYMFDVLSGMIAVAIMIMILLVGTMVLNTVEDGGVFAGDADADAAFTQSQSALGVLDQAMLIIVIAVGLGAVVSAFLVDSHPLLFIVFIIINVIVWMVAAPLGNALEQVLLSGGFAATTNDIPIALLIMQWLPIISIVFGFIMAIVVGIPRRRG